MADEAKVQHGPTETAPRREGDGAGDSAPAADTAHHSEASVDPKAIDALIERTGSLANDVAAQADAVVNDRLRGASAAIPAGLPSPSQTHTPPGQPLNVARIVQGHAAPPRAPVAHAPGSQAAAPGDPPLSLAELDESLATEASRLAREQDLPLQEALDSMDESSAFLTEAEVGTGAVDTVPAPATAPGGGVGRPQPAPAPSPQAHVEAPPSTERPSADGQAAQVPQATVAPAPRRPDRETAPEHPAEPARPGRSAGAVLRTVLMPLSFPLKVVPESKRFIIDWLALSLALWAPLVWLLATLMSH